MTLIFIFLHIEASMLGSPPSNTKLKRCAKKLNMSQSHYIIGLLILTSVVWIKVL